MSPPFPRFSTALLAFGWLTSSPLQADVPTAKPSPVPPAQNATRPQGWQDQRFGLLVPKLFDPASSNTVHNIKLARESGAGYIVYSTNLVSGICLSVFSDITKQPPPCLGDFDTPKLHPGRFQNTRPWESVMSLVDTPPSGSTAPNRVKSFSACLKAFLGCATGDGNLLLEVQPDGKGNLSADQATRLRELGRWLQRYGESIYGTRGGPFANGGWGGSTYRGNRVYLHIQQWNGDHLALPPLKASILTYTNLCNPRSGLTCEQTKDGILLTLPPAGQDSINTIVAIDLDRPASDELLDGRPLKVVPSSSRQIILPETDGSMLLSSDKAIIHGSTARLQETDGNSIITYWTASDKVSWQAKVTRAGTYAVQLTYTCIPSHAGSEYIFQIGDQAVHGKIAATKTWTDYQTVTIGTVNIAQTGLLTVNLRPTRTPAVYVMTLRKIRLVPTILPERIITN